MVVEEDGTVGDVDRPDLATPGLEPPSSPGIDEEIRPECPLQFVPGQRRRKRPDPINPKLGIPASETDGDLDAGVIPNIIPNPINSIAAPSPDTPLPPMGRERRIQPPLVHEPEPGCQPKPLGGQRKQQRHPSNRPFRIKWGVRRAEGAGHASSAYRITLPGRLTIGWLLTS